MELKKNPKYDVRRQSSTFFLIGLLFALTLTLAAFKYTSSEEEVAEAADYGPIDDVEELADITRQDQPPPPAPPPPPPTTVEVVEDDVETNDEPLPDTDQNQDYNPTEGQKPIEEPQPENTGEQEIFTIVEKDPAFTPGGEEGMRKFIQKNLVYPPLAVENGLQGKVIVQFVVEIDGHVSDVKALKTFDDDCAAEAVRVVKLMRFTPGQQRNKSVRTKMVMPITFKLN